MFKRIIGLLFAVVIAASVLTACGAKSAQATSTRMDRAVEAQAPPVAPAGQAANDAKPKQEEAKASFGSNAAKETPAGVSYSVSSNDGTGSSGQPLQNAILAQRKLIRNANVTVEVEDFDIAYGKIKSLIEGFGFIQETNIRTDKIHADAGDKLVRKGIIVIRVDKDKFESILLGVKGLGLLIEENIKGDDVTEQYFDIESRLKLLRYEESRIMQYLEKLTDPDTIFKTESRLTDIRHEIESLTGTLKKWDDLVQLSTITINMNEKIPQAAAIASGTYWGRLSQGFSSSFRGVVNFCGDLVIFLVKALPVLVLLAVFALIILAICRRIARKNVKMWGGSDKPAAGSSTPDPQKPENMQK